MVEDPRNRKDRMDGPEYTFENPLEGHDLDNNYDGGFYEDEELMDYGREGRDDNFDNDYGIEDADYGAEVESSNATKSSKSQGATKS